MRLPKAIWAALNSEQGFDKLYITNHLKLKSHIKAYQATLRQIRQYLPDYEPLQSEESHRVKAWKTSKKEVEVPDNLLAVFTDFEEIYFEYIREHKTYKNAYIALMSDVNRYFPDYVHSKNWDSFRRARCYHLNKKSKGN